MKKTIAIGIAVLLACLVLIPSVSATWCDNDYGKKAPILINNTGGSAQTYYQVELNFTHDSDMNSNFSDIRVYNDSDCSLIPLWNESAVASSYNKIWFNATNIPASAWCNDTYYLYYNFSTASSASNGTATFEFFDNFEEDTTLNYKIFATDGTYEDGLAVAYYGDVTNPTAIYVPSQNKTFIIYQSGSPPTTCDRKILYYNHTTNTFSSAVAIGGMKKAESHGQPAIAIDASGYIYVFYYGGSGDPTYFKKTTNPYNITSWSAEQTVSGGAHAYHNPFLHDEDIYLFYVNYSGTNRCYSFNRYNGTSWNSETRVIDWDSNYPYSSTHRDTLGTFHVAWSWLVDGKRQNIYYMNSTDGGSTWTMANGTSVTIPVNETTAEKVYDSGGNYCHMILGDMQTDSTGKPLILFNSNQVYKLARWNGTAWVINDVVNVNHDSDCGTLVIDSDTQYRAYINIGAGRGGEIYEYLSIDSGVTWNYQKTIASGTAQAVMNVYNMSSDGNLEIVFCGGDGGGEAVCAWGKNCTYTSKGWVSEWSDSYSGTITQSSTKAKSGVYSGKFDPVGINGGVYRTIPTMDNGNSKSIILYANVNQTDQWLDIPIVCDGCIGASSIDYNKVAVQLYFGTDSNIKYYDGTQQTLQAYSVDTWYKIELNNFNFTANTYDIYINDVLKKADAGFRNAQSQITQILSRIGTDNGQIGYYDCFNIRKYTSLKPTASLGTEEDAPAGDTYTPPNPTNLQNTTGNFWVNYTWSPDSGNVTNGYNVTWNSSWYNTSNTYMNKSVGASNWANITVWAWNSSGSGTMSAGNVSDEVQVSAMDTTFTVSLPSGYTKPVFQPPNSTATNYPPNGQQSHRKQWTVTNINATTLTNYPAYVNVTDEPEMQADWDDVVFTDSSGNLIPYELENYTTGFADYWVNISSLPGNGTYTGWMYYGNDGASSQENPEGVYDSHTKMVHHMQDLVDSTSNNNDATNHGATYTSSGIVDGAYDFNDTASNYWDCGNDTNLNITDAITIEVWVKSIKNDAYQGIVAKAEPGWIDGYEMQKHSGNGFRFVISKDSSPQTAESDVTYTDSDYHHLVGVYDGVGYLYVDAALQTDTAIGDIGGNSKKLGIGTYWNGASSVYPFNGTIDNVIISSTARSADWINQSYELVVNQSSWVSWGGAEEGTPFFNVTNTGNVNLDVRMRLNATVNTITLKADTDNNPTGAKEINTTLATLYSGLGQGNSADIWLWSDFDHTPAQTANRTVYINVSES